MYKIQPLVESNFDFSLINPQAQREVAEASGVDFDLSSIVKFLQKQTNNFTIENTIAKDLDEAIFKSYEKYKSEKGGEKVEVEVESDQVEQGIREAIEILETLGDDASEEERQQTLESIIKLVNYGNISKDTITLIETFYNTDIETLKEIFV
jgi:hypothetical protein